MAPNPNISSIQFRDWGSHIDARIPDWGGEPLHVGSLGWETDYSDPERPREVANVFVNKQFRRQGVASKMWDMAQQPHPDPHDRRGPLRHSPDRTDAGDAWARSVGGEIPEQTPDVEWSAEWQR